MPNDGSADPASFRDPGGRVYRIGDRIFRTITDSALHDFEAVRASGLYDDLAAAGKVVPAAIASRNVMHDLDQEVRLVLEHPQLPFISYPYEWSFSALKAAALLHIDVHLAALERGFTLSDASAYNVQFKGAEPVFIDTLSFRPYRTGEYWTGHRQFCEQFLNPLLLRALLRVSHNQWYRGSLDGISTQDLARLLPFRRKLAWDVLSNVVLPAKFEHSARCDILTVSAESLKTVTFPLRSYRRLLKRLQSWIARLEPHDKTPTTWQNYSLDNSYGPDEAQAKRGFVRDLIRGVKPAMVWDVGCNAGDYAVAALESGAKYVVGWDFDQGALDAAFKRAADNSLAFTPLFLDAVNPSPDQGWAQAERRGMARRGPADAVLALAIVHHLAIAKNVPLAKIAAWIADFGRSGVVEFVPKSDRMVQEMLRLRDDIFPTYDLDHFLSELRKHAAIERTSNINGRQLIWFRSSRRRD